MAYASRFELQIWRLGGLGPAAPGLEAEATPAAHGQGRAVSQVWLGPVPPATAALNENGHRGQDWFPGILQPERAGCRSGWASLSWPEIMNHFILFWALENRDRPPRRGSCRPRQSRGTGWTGEAA